jgi:hypothetical protein
LGGVGWAHGPKYTQKGKTREKKVSARQEDINESRVQLGAPKRVLQIP